MTLHAIDSLLSARIRFFEYPVKLDSCGEIGFLIYMPVWEFLDYVEASGRVPIREWASDLPMAAQATIDERILAMESLAKWPEKWASSYTGAEGILELRISFNRVQYRPLGMYSPTRRMAFILLCGAIEKGGKLPKSVLKTALRRRNEILAEPHRVQPHSF